MLKLLVPFNNFERSGFAGKVRRLQAKVVNSRNLMMGMLLISVSVEAKKIELRINNLSTVRTNSDITLSDLLADPNKTYLLPEHLLNANIADSINSESEVILFGSDLAKKVRQSLSFQELQSYSFIFPQEIKIKAVRNFLSTSSIQRSIMVESQKYCSSCEIVMDELQIDTQGIKGEILSSRIHTENLRGGGSFVIPMIFETSQGKLQKLITGRLSFYQQGLVAKKYLSSGISLQPEDFETQKVNVTFSKDAVPRIDDIRGKILARSLSVGQPIFLGDLKKEVAASRGQTVKILIQGENFEITAEGVAEQSGAPGDVILVKNLNTQKVISALVLEKGVVSLQ